MGNRVEEKELCKVAEFVFVYDKDNLWISLEFLGKNKIMENKFRESISNTREIHDLCVKICAGIDKIVNISSNKNIIINIIKSFNNESNKMPIYTMSWGTITEYDENNEVVECSANVFTKIDNGALSYLQKNNEYARLYNYLIENCNDFTLLGSELYYIAKECYDKVMN